MQLTRQEKETLVDELAAMIDDHPVVGVLDMHSLPARQLQEIKKEMVDHATIKMTRKTLIHLALEQSDKDTITDLKDNPAIQPALIFTEQNPFSLYKTIQAKKSSAAASGGEIAPNDIVVEEGLTDLDPGPMLGRIQELGASTSVEDGKIKVENTTVAVEEGAVIDNNTAEILNNLGMKPLEVGLDLKLVYQDGDVFDKDVLSIDAEDYRADIESAASGAFNLAVNAGYITERTVEPMLQEQASKARNLAVNAGVINEETVEPLLSEAAGHAGGLDDAVDVDSVDLDDSNESESTDAEAADEDTESEDTDAEDSEPADNEEGSDESANTEDEANENDE
jgi:large subunit ribosomal protein L10